MWMMEWTRTCRLSIKISLSLVSGGADHLIDLDDGLKLVQGSLESAPPRTLLEDHA